MPPRRPARDITPASPAPALLERAREIHSAVVSVDSHVDIPFHYATPFADPGRRDTFRVDYPKMREGGLDAAFFIVFVPQGERTPHATRVAGELALTKFAAIHRAIESHPEQIALARRASDVAQIARAQRLVAAIGVENGYVIGTDLARIAAYHELGARYLTLTHNGTNEICDPAIHIRGDRPEEWGGLSPFGREVVAELNRVGMMIDVSHTSRTAMLQATALSRSPVIASHSNARALCDHPRNLDDEQLDAIRDVGGVVQCVALGGFVTALAGSHDTVSVADFVNHIDYVAERIGIEHVGIASDFDGGGGIHGWNDASETFNVTLALVARGYGASDIEKIWGGNLIRVWKAAERAAETSRSSPLAMSRHHRQV